MSASKLQSWGHYPYAPQSSHPLSWRDAVQAALDQTRERSGTTLAFGNGRSYGDSCLAATDHVLHMRGLGRFISADWTTGIVRAEAGVTLGEVLAQSIPRGWMLQVTPGTQFVTLGGAVANDVHGKNHHVRGTFGRHVRRFSLLRSDRPPTECAPGENEELFRATIGGLGLTGVIEWVEIQLMQVQSSHISMTRIRFGNLDEFLALSHELDPQHEYGVAWVDCLASGAALGRGLYMCGDHASDGDLSMPAKRGAQRAVRAAAFADQPATRSSRSTRSITVASCTGPSTRGSISRAFSTRSTASIIGTASMGGAVSSSISA